MQTSQDPAPNAKKHDATPKAKKHDTTPKAKKRDTTPTAFVNLIGGGRIVVSFKDVTIKHYTDLGDEAIENGEYDNVIRYFTSVLQYFTEASKCGSSESVLTEQERSDIKQKIINACAHACDASIDIATKPANDQELKKDAKYIEKPNYQEFRKAAEYIEKAILLASGSDYQEFSDTFMNTCIRAFNLAMDVRCDDLLLPSYNLTNSLSTPRISRPSRIPTENWPRRAASY